MKGLMRTRVGGALIAFLLLATDAAACTNDRDCPAGSRCVIGSFGAIEGVCQRGVAPIEGDEWRIQGREGPKIGAGQACEFSVDCAEGLTCQRVENSSVRTCRR
jgi:hypothetical protein